MVQIGSKLRFGGGVGAEHSISAVKTILAVQFALNGRFHVTGITLWGEVVVNFTVNRFVYLRKTSIVVCFLLLLSKCEDTFIVWSDHVNLSIVWVGRGLVSPRSWILVLSSSSSLSPNTSQPFFANISHVFFVCHGYITRVMLVSSPHLTLLSVMSMLLHHLRANIWKRLRFSLIQICAQFMKPFQSFSSFNKRSLLLLLMTVALLTSQILSVTSIDRWTSWQATNVLLLVRCYSHDVRLVHLIGLPLNSSPSLLDQVKFRLTFKLLLSTQLSQSSGWVDTHYGRFRLVVLLLLRLQKMVSSVCIGASWRNTSWCVHPIRHNSRIDALNWLDWLCGGLLGSSRISTHLSATWKWLSFIVLQTLLLGFLLMMILGRLGHLITGSLLLLVVVDQAVKTTILLRGRLTTGNAYTWNVFLLVNWL